MLRRGGLENTTGDRERYLALGDAEITALAPEVVLLSSEPYPSADKHVAEVQALTWCSSTASRSRGTGAA